jgi:predicted Zn-dependent protease
MQATALHELGHAFGLWGHSDRADDAMAAVPRAMPIVELSARDRATFLWLQQQPPLQLPPATSP